MLSPLRANHLACARPLSFNYARNFASTSNGNRRKSARPPKSAKVSPEPASSPLPPPPAHRDASDGGDSLAASLNHYNSLPPLPPIDKWLSHFPYAPPVVRDRMSIRVPESAIRVAHSFINSKRTSTGNPKVIIEAFPGAWCLGTLTAFLTSRFRSRCHLQGPPDSSAVRAQTTNYIGRSRALFRVSSRMCFASFFIFTSLRYTFISHLLEQTLVYG